MTTPPDSRITGEIATLIEEIKPSTTNKIKEELPSDFTENIDYDSECAPFFLPLMQYREVAQGGAPDSNPLDKNTLESVAVYTAAQKNTYVPTRDNPTPTFIEEGK